MSAEPTTKERVRDVSEAAVVQMLQALAVGRTVLLRQLWWVT